MNFSDKQILIIDNDFASAYLIIEAFGYTGAKFIYVSDGSAALDICRNCLLNLVLVGNRLTGIMDGIELTKKIKQNHFEIPVLAYSGNADIGNINEFYDAGCDYFIAKPVDTEQLTSIFTTYLDMYSELHSSLNLLKNNDAFHLNPN